MATCGRANGRQNSHSCQIGNKINLCVRDGCVGRAAAAWLSETGSRLAFDAKKEFRVQLGWLPMRLKNTLSSMAKVRRQPAAKKPAAKKPAKRMRDSLGPTKCELRCAAKSQTKNCYLGGSKALYQASAQQRRARSLRAKKASAAARRP